MVLEHYEVKLIGHKRVSKIEFYRDAGDAIRWRCTAPNHEIIGASSESFLTMESAKKNTFMLAATLAAFDFDANRID